MANRRIADLLIKIGADSYEFQQQVTNVEKGLNKLSKNLNKIGKEMSLKVTAPIVAFGALSVKAFDDSAKAQAKVQQAIKSTGGAAKLSYQELSKYAGELQGKTLFEDDFILTNSTATLLTFTNIADDCFKRTQSAALDLATIFQMDLKSASLMLGKALNDPVKGLTALGRAGVQFSAEQKKVITDLVKTNQLAKAQGLILEEVEKQVGGQAQAAAKVGAGALVQLKNQFGDFMEQIGAALMPFVNKITAMLSTVTTSLQSLSPEALKITIAIGGIAAAIGPLLIGIGSVIKLLPLLATGLSAVMSPVVLITGAITALGAAFFYAYLQKKKLYDDTVNTLSQKTPDELNSLLSQNRQKQKKVSAETTKWRFANTGTAGISFMKIPDMDALDKLQKEESAIVDAINKRASAEKEAAKADAETKKKIQEITDALTGANVQTQQSTGLIGKLKTQIEALEKKKLLPTSTVEDIAAANDEIKKLQQELNALQNATSTTIPNPIAGNQVIAPSKMKIDLKPMFSEYQQQMKQIQDAVVNGVYGWADLTSEKMRANVQGISAVVANYTDALVEKGVSFQVALEAVSAKIAEVMSAFNDGIRQFLADSIVATVESIGSIISGDMGFGDLFKNILSLFASFLKDIGKQLIEFALLMIMFQESLATILANPWIALGVGVAMVAAAGVMTALINKRAKDKAPKLASGGLAYGPTYAMVGDNRNASVDPEVISPLSKLKQLLPTAGASNVNVNITGELKAKGRDLSLVLSQNNYRLSLIRG